MKNLKILFKNAYVLMLILLSISNKVLAEPFTVDCGHNKRYDEIRLIVDLESKTIKKAWLLGETPSKATEYIVYDISDEEVRAHSDDKFFTEIGVYSRYLVLNRYDLHLFMASGEDWNNPPKDGNIKGSGAECRKLQKAF